MPLFLAEGKFNPFKIRIPLSEVFVMLTLLIIIFNQVFIVVNQIKLALMNDSN